MGEVYAEDTTNPVSNLLLLIIFVIILCLCFYTSGCISIDKTGFRAGIIDDSDYDNDGVEIHQRSCTGISVLW